MSPRPAIFISAVSRELKSARQLVANTLTFLGYEPDWQDIFGIEEGTYAQYCGAESAPARVWCSWWATATERSRPYPTSNSAGSVTLSTKRSTPRVREKRFGTSSWATLFPLIRTIRGAGRELQGAYRARVQADSHLYHPLSSSEGLEASGAEAPG